MKLISLILVLLQIASILAEKPPNSTNKSSPRNLVFTIPPYTGKIPSNGQPYQIVRVIEYIVPKTKGKTQLNKTETMRTLVSNSSQNPPVKSTVPIGFLMKVRQNKTIICMGALITAKVVLSSTVCFSKNPLPKEYEVQDNKNHIHALNSIYLGTSFGYELAIIKLAVAIELDASIQTVPLCHKQLGQHNSVNMYMTRLQRPHFLRTQIIGNAACKRSYVLSDSAYITENMLCIQNSNISKDCQLTAVGDPLLHEGQLCGINIYPPSCVDGAVNGDLYADVFKANTYIKWIIEHTAKL